MSGVTVTKVISRSFGKKPTVTVHCPALLAVLKAKNTGQVVCLNEISNCYVQGCLDDADFLFVAEFDGAVVGFVTCEYEMHDLYVSLLCANKGNVGVLLMRDYVMPLALHHQFVGIGLNAVVSKITYYQKNFGFLIGRDCDDMDAPLTKRAFVKGPDGALLKFTNDETMIENCTLKPFFNALAKRDYLATNKKACKDSKKFSEGTDDFRYTCVRSGIFMYLCLPTPTCSKPAARKPSAHQTPKVPLACKGSLRKNDRRTRRTPRK